MITKKWNHNHPQGVPSKFEVFKNGELIYAGTYREGMCLGDDDDGIQGLKNRMRKALEIIDDHVACASTRNKLKGLLDGSIK
jgi:hypothetical protein